MTKEWTTGAQALLDEPETPAPQLLAMLVEQNGNIVRMLQLPGVAPEVICTPERAFVCAGLFDASTGAMLYRPASCFLLFPQKQQRGPV